MFPAIKFHAPPLKLINPPFQKVKPYLSFSLNSPYSPDTNTDKPSSLPFSSSLSFSSTIDQASPSSLASSVGSPPFPHLAQWNLSRRRVHFLGAIACTAAISASWLFFCAIPALLAFRRAAESMEKLLDVMTEELPDTMAAVRLSGMEISDLTMELSDLGQEITQGVRNSTRAVRIAEERLRHLTNMAPTALVQEQATPKTMIMEPTIARTARNIREAIVNGRSIFQLLFSLNRFSRWAAGMRKR